MSNEHPVTKAKSRKAIAFTGPSGSGKTTIIEKVSKILSLQKHIVTVKHDPSDKAVFDTQGKDSNRFFESGADVAVVSPTRTTIFTHQNREIPQIADMFDDFDLMIVEGLRNTSLPRIAIFRNDIDKSYFPVIRAIAIDDSIDISQYNIPSNIEIVDLNDTDAIIRWINQNSVEI